VIAKIMAHHNEVFIASLFLFYFIVYFKKFLYLIIKHMDNNPSSPGGDVLIVAHSHLLRILACRWLNMAPEQGKHFILDTAVSV
jgi:hypothetical protein